jgi:hypothetical protein
MQLQRLEAYLDQEQNDILSSLNSPAEIQAFLDSIPYSPENNNRCPVSVLRDRQAHCLDGALFAAAALHRLGFPPILVDLLPEPGADDDHVLAIYKVNGYYGAVAKSNFSGLRFREPVYHPLRELAMSYFEDFFNVNGKKTLRAYTVPLRLSRMDGANWMWSDEGADEVERHLTKLRKLMLLTPQMAANLALADPLSYQAGMLGVNAAGLYKPAD